MEIKHTLKQQLDQRKKSQVKLEHTSTGRKAKSQYTKTYGCSGNSAKVEISSYKCLYQQQQQQQQQLGRCEIRTLIL